MSSSLSHLIGQPLTWVRAGRGFDLTASDGAVIASYPVKSGGGWFAQRYNTSEARISDGTGKLFLNREGEDIVISGDEQGPLLARYRKSHWLEFPDRRVFFWEQPGFFRDNIWKDPSRWGAMVWRDPSVKQFEIVPPEQIEELRAHWRTLANGREHIPGTLGQEPPAAYVRVSDGSIKYRVAIFPPAAELRDPELSMLLVLGFYNLRQRNREHSAELARLAGDARGIAH